MAPSASAIVCASGLPHMVTMPRAIPSCARVKGVPTSGVIRSSGPCANGSSTGISLGSFFFLFTAAPTFFACRSMISLTLQFTPASSGPC